MSSNLIPQVTIREAVLEDLEAIRVIEQANFSTEVAGAETIQKWIECVPNTCLIAELNEKIAVYLVGSAVFSRRLANATSDKSEKRQQDSDFMTIQRLSIHPDFKGQGLGTLLLAACKEITVAQNQKGLQLVCSDELISYYEMNAFINEGISEKIYNNTVLYELVWDNPYFKE
ncbi:Acetyltransferase (GNAT) family protein [Streptococcus constellatus]|uniref:Acetyltransferase (GNAT) family protein n=1 Tax=Streptococcus constellatus TaxID=76860 RepID=A0A564U1M8_STRCV|nr:GNAT family N-acetyltransferase [Streptococcus constellatus]VUW98953.1 Acetyltransferase (GNAT) family protein [Streptococcus gordonii]VUX13370.1 Acetyltransferase (GNAT) family protein [Streptococcus constellatus]